MNKSYYAIIPANVRYDNRLNANAKLLYGEITALSNEKGFCWATNNYFAQLYKKNKKTVSLWISQLNKYGYIHIKFIYKEKSKEILNRHIYIISTPIPKNMDTPIPKNMDTPIPKNVKDNNTLINNKYSSDEEYQVKEKSNNELNDKNKKYIPLAKLLYDEHRKTDENFLSSKNLDSTFKRWANDIRLLVENDKRDFNLVIEVIKWCQSPGCFWISNILSGRKLREKFSMLYSQYMRDKNKTKVNDPELEKRMIKYAFLDD